MLLLIILLATLGSSLYIFLKPKNPPRVMIQSDQSTQKESIENTPQQSYSEAKKNA